MTIKDILHQASLKLSYSDSPELDAEILLSHVLQVNRVYLYTWPERNLDSSVLQLFWSLINERKRGIPIAYLIGKKEFWSFNLFVNESTLIPRPETELLVSLTLAKVKQADAIVTDLGTGSGAIAIALASERPDWTIYATDISAEALAVARQNADNYHLTKIKFCQGDWCAALPTVLFDAIVSNPPYISSDDPHLMRMGLNYEPQIALVAAEHGLADLQNIIFQSKKYLKLGGWLLLEHGYQHSAAVRECLAEAGYEAIATEKDVMGNDRVSYGKIL
jgi:release factor glutamine methyltransferase